MEKKIIFITHVTNMVGGASQSLKNLISSFGQKVDLMAPKNLMVSNKVLRDFYGENVNRIYRYDLPFRMSVRAISNEKCRWSDWCQRELKYKVNQKKIDRILNKYDVVHLNSYVLYPMIKKKYPMYIHVREVCNANFVVKKLIQLQFYRSHGIIYIDDVVKNALGIGKRCIVLNNPIDQSKTKEVDLAIARNEYHIDEDETVFSFIVASSGTIEKGLYFIIDSFLRANCEKTRLLIVGPLKIEKYADYNNVTFVGEVKQMEKIYAITDYVLRGDEIFTIGRTIYEGLYSGCNVIIPGDAELDSVKVFEYQRFKNRIFFYTPRNMESFIKIIQERAKEKKANILGISNIDNYVIQFKNFIIK